MADQNTVRCLDGNIKPKILNCGMVDSIILKLGINTVKVYRIIKFRKKLKKINTIPEKGSEISLKIGTMNIFSKDRATSIKAIDLSSSGPKLNPLIAFLLKINAI